MRNLIQFLLSVKTRELFCKHQVQIQWGILKTLLYYTIFFEYFDNVIFPNKTVIVCTAENYRFQMSYRLQISSTGLPQFKVIIDQNCYASFTFFNTSREIYNNEYILGLK